MYYCSTTVIFFCVLTCTLAEQIPDCAAEIRRAENELESTRRFLRDAVYELQTLENEAHTFTSLFIEHLIARTLGTESDEESDVDPASDPNFPHACMNEEHLRLVNGSTPAEGRLEVKEGDQWKIVCESTFNQFAAQYVCAMLGYPDKQVAAVGSRVFGNGNLPALAGSTLGSCSYGAGVICQGLENYPVRLIGGSGPHEGRVELRVNGQWAGLCDDSFDTQDAKVICRQLGFDRGLALATVNGYFGNGTGPMWGNNLQCAGTEQHIMSCGGANSGPYMVGYSSTSCSYRDAAGVVCDNFYNYPIRLVNGSTPYEGRVEVRIGDHWSAIYHGNWDSNDASVVCRQLGYSPIGAVARMYSYFGAPAVNMEIGYLNCQGTEHHLLECPMSYGLNYTTFALSSYRTQSAGVTCQP